MNLRKLYSVCLLIFIIAGCGEQNSSVDDLEKNEENIIEEHNNNVEELEDDQSEKAKDEVEESEKGKNETEGSEKEEEEIEENKRVGEGVQSEKVPFTLLTTKEISDHYPHVYQYVNYISNQDIRDYRIFLEEGYEIIAVSTGIKSSGGYRIEVVEIVNQGSTTVIKLEEHAPPDGAIVTQALVNPTIAFSVAKEKINDDKLFYLNGKPFEKYGLSES